MRPEIKYSEHTSKSERKEIAKYYKDRKKVKPKKKTTKLSPIQRRKKMPYKKFIKSKYWQDVRLIVLKRDSFKCAKCDEREPLHIHHKTYKNRGNEKKHLNDLITLCDLCHKEQHKKKKG